MKKLYTLLFTCIMASAFAQKELPKLLQGNGPQFSYSICLDQLKKKDQYCTRYDYNYKLANDSLYITVTEIAHVDNPKKKSERVTYYKVAKKDIYANESLSRFSSEYTETEYVKDLTTGYHNRVVKFSFYSVISSIQCSGWGYFGKVEKKNKITLCAESYTDAKALLEYFK